MTFSPMSPCAGRHKTPDRHLSAFGPAVPVIPARPGSLGGVRASGDGGDGGPRAAGFARGPVPAAEQLVGDPGVAAGVAHHPHPAPLTLAARAAEEPGRA